MIDTHSRPLCQEKGYGDKFLHILLEVFLEKKTRVSISFWQEHQKTLAWALGHKLGGSSTMHIFPLGINLGTTITEFDIMTCIAFNHVQPKDSTWALEHKLGG